MKNNNVMQVSISWVDVYCERHTFVCSSFESYVPYIVEFYLNELRRKSDFLNFCGLTVEEAKE